MNNIEINTGCDTSHKFDGLMQELADTIELHRLPVGAYKEIEDLMNKLHRQADEDIERAYDEGYKDGRADENDLKDELVDLEERIEDLEDENRDLDSQIGDLTCELEEAQERITELEEELSEYV
jgi:predicted nuclease with TOPRIM domain